MNTLILRHCYDHKKQTIYCYIAFEILQGIFWTDLQHKTELKFSKFLW